MNIRAIKTEEDYDLALSRLNSLFDAPAESLEGEEADILAILINEYEEKNHRIDLPDPIEAIKIRMEEMGLRQVDLVEVIGGKSRVSEILSKKRKLTVDMIRSLSAKLNISAQVLISDYQLIA